MCARGKGAGQVQCEINRTNEATGKPRQGHTHTQTHRQTINETMKTARVELMKAAEAAQAAQAALVLENCFGYNSRFQLLS